VYTMKPLKLLVDGGFMKPSITIDKALPDASVDEVTFVVKVIVSYVAPYEVE
jgi:hypothetical protein